MFILNFDWFKRLFGREADSSEGGSRGGDRDLEERRKNEAEAQQGSANSTDLVHRSLEALTQGIPALKEAIIKNNDLVSSAEDVLKSDEFTDYVTGLLSTQKEENALNREFNSAQSALNRQFQSDEARLQREWYEGLSNSAYQRSVADMKAAGINPILAYQQGGAASSGTGVPAGSAAAYTATGGDSLSAVLSATADVLSAVGGSAKSFSKIFKILKG